MKKTKEINIRTYIRYGRDNAISRQSLEAETGLSDRKVRGLIQQSAQDTSLPPIVNIGYGYFIATPDDAEAVNEYCNKETSRIRNIQTKVRKYRKWIDKVNPLQMKMRL